MRRVVLVDQQGAHTLGIDVKALRLEMFIALDGFEPEHDARPREELQTVRPDLLGQLEVNAKPGKGEGLGGHPGDERARRPA